MKSIAKLWLSVLCLLTLIASPALASAPPAKNPQTGAVGLNGHINAAPPATAPTITTPTNGASFTTLPIRVAGLCTGSLLIEVFKNNVFSGSTTCSNGSYSMQIDLFSGKNDLVARAYDALNQPSPDSNTVSVTFSDQLNPSGQRIEILSNYATRGANPGAELSWPLSLIGGTAPYAVSVNWGDGTDAELLSQKNAGDFNITHTYKNSGTYNVIIKATDANGDAAFLQVVAVANGPAAQTTASGTISGGTNTKILWLPVIVLAVLVLSSFWLGKKHQLTVIRKRLNQGQRPF